MEERFVIVYQLIFLLRRQQFTPSYYLFQVKFSDLEGKAVLVVNVASQCGFTDGHYKGLKRLHDILAFNHKLAILGWEQIKLLKQ